MDELLNNSDGSCAGSESGALADSESDQPPHLVVDHVHGGITPGEGNLIPGK